MTNAEWLVSEWSTRFVDVMHTMAEAKPQMQFTATAEAPQGELLWWKQAFSCSPQAPFWVGAQQEGWTAVGEAVLASAGVENAAEAEIRSTWFEILSQSMGGLAEAMSGRISTEVTCGEGLEARGERGAGEVFEVTADIAATPRIKFYLIVNESLSDAMSADAAAEHTAPPPLQPSTQGGSEKSESRSPYEHLGEVAGSRTFELLLDVELPVSVSFGRATMQFREALNLISGSLIELDRTLADPVELLVNNCVIARGEVVVVDGNYGVRLTEIISHKERLQQARRQMLS